ncbi:MAG: anhydro-N-acetylmuramic acid kinase, partial [Proteobacteria bacterium]|nr:anhydro-N-acetylmuramic acid kinase [Pseudomonadota bacterium]
MSGTSMDAIDAALVSFNGKASLKSYREYPIDNSLRYQIRNITEHSEIAHISELDNELGYLFAKAVNDLLKGNNLNADDIAAIGSHGQTILHRPYGHHPTSIQIGDPNIISRETGILTIADFRRMDMAVGGQGAPLASAFHQYQFQQKEKNIVVLNIGGMANITLLSDAEVIGFDTGPGNALMEEKKKKNLDKEYDKDGAWAKQGNVNQKLLELMLSDNYFSRSAPKSTGREYFNLSWLNQYIEKTDSSISNEDIQATLLQLTAKTICDAIDSTSKHINEVIACGGGAFNKLLMKHLQERLGKTELFTTK